MGNCTIQHCFNHAHTHTHRSNVVLEQSCLLACPRAVGLGQEVRLQNCVTPLSRLDPETGRGEGGVHGLGGSDCKGECGIRKTDGVIDLMCDL